MISLIYTCLSLGIGTGSATAAAAGESSVEVLKGHTDKVTCVAIAPDGKRALSTSDDRTVREWDLVAGKPLRVLKEHKDYALAAAYLPGGRALTSGGGQFKGKHFGLGSDFALRLWTLTDPPQARSLPGHAGPVWSIAVSHDGKMAVTGSGGWTDPPTIKPHGFGAFVWDLESGSHRELKGHEHWVQSVAMSADGGRAVTGSWDKVVRIWDLAEAKLLLECKGHTEMVNSVAYSPNGKRVLSGSGAGAIFVWNAETGKKVGQLVGHRKRVWSVAFSRDGKRALSACADNSVRLWDIESSKEIKVFHGHTDEVRRAVFAPDERSILSGSHDKTLRWWRIDLGTAQ